MGYSFQKHRLPCASVLRLVFAARNRSMIASQFPGCCGISKHPCLQVRSESNQVRGHDSRDIVRASTSRSEDSVCGQNQLLQLLFDACV